MIPLLGVTKEKENMYPQNMYITICVAAPFIIAPILETTHMFINRRINKLHIHKLKYPSAMKRTELQTHSATWMDVKNTM